MRYDGCVLQREKIGDRNRPALHGPAIGLTLVLLAAFVLITSAYARWGIEVVEPTFRESQLGIVEGREGWGAIVIYEDTLRVFPDDDGIRRLLAAEYRRVGRDDRAAEIEEARTSASDPESPDE